MYREIEFPSTFEVFIFYIAGREGSRENIAWDDTRRSVRAREHIRCLMTSRHVEKEGRKKGITLFAVAAEKGEEEDAHGKERGLEEVVASLADYAVRSPARSWPRTDECSLTRDMHKYTRHGNARRTRIRRRSYRRGHPVASSCETGANDGVLRNPDYLLRLALIEFDFSAISGSDTRVTAVSEVSNAKTKSEILLVF